MKHLRQTADTFDVLTVHIDPSPELNLDINLMSSHDYSLGYKLDMAGIKVLAFTEIDCGYMVEFACSFGSNPQRVKDVLFGCFKAQYGYRRRLYANEEIDDLVVIGDPYSALAA